MSKITKLAAIVAVMVSSVAMAGEFATVEFQGAKTYGNAVQSDTGSLVVGTQRGPVTLDVKLQTERQRDAGTNANDVQFRVTAPVGPVWVRVGLGKQVDGGLGDNTYYTYAAGVDYSIYKNIVLNASAERQKAFDGAKPTFETYRFGATYALTAVDYVGAAWVINRGDVDAHAVGVNYTRKFN
jgi:hypothetical protein